MTKYISIPYNYCVVFWPGDVPEKKEIKMALLFDTHVQKMKYNVLREVAKLAYRDELTPQRIMEIAPRIIPEGKPMFRCCIYKERAIINERVSMALQAHRRRLAVSQQRVL